MPGVLSTIQDAVGDSGISILPSERVNLDAERFAEYRDSEEHPASRLFETDGETVTSRRTPTLSAKDGCLLTYFLDGSRRTYKVADIVMRGRYLPLVAGQVGVAVVQRDRATRWLSPCTPYCVFESILAVPDGSMSADDIKALERRIAEETRFPFTVLRYRVKEHADPVDLGVAKIMARMHEREVESVQRMAAERQLSNSNVLVIDGPLRFRRQFDVVQFRNVVGLSKSFRPSFTQGRGRKRKSVGEITAALRFGQRSPVFETTEGPNKIGMWYLRIHDEKLMSNPIQGVIKIEAFAVSPEDRERGLDTERVNILSAHMLRERNVTPYGRDLRWASHIYPIYMAETYAKNRFMSDTAFKALF